MTGPRAANECESASVHSMFVQNGRRYEGHKRQQDAATASSKVEAMGKLRQVDQETNPALFLALLLALTHIRLCNLSHTTRRDPGTIFGSHTVHKVTLFF